MSTADELALIEEQIEKLRGYEGLKKVVQELKKSVITTSKMAKDNNIKQAEMEHKLNIIKIGVALGREELDIDPTELKVLHRALNGLLHLLADIGIQLSIQGKEIDELNEGTLLAQLIEAAIKKDLPGIVNGYMKTREKREREAKRQEHKVSDVQAGPGSCDE